MSKESHITINDKEYEIYYTIARVKLIERELGKSLVSEVATSSGLLTISTMFLFFKYGLKEVGGSFVQPKFAEKVFDKIVEQGSYDAVLDLVSEAIYRDVPFLFRKGSSITNISM